VPHGDDLAGLAAQRTLIAPSLTEFIELIAADFEQGRLTWDEEWGGVYAPST
jgi:hypothetical protein